MSLPKPYYQRGPVTLYHGDCLELLPHLPRVDAVVTDPPYGVGFKYASHDDKRDGYEEWCARWFDVLPSENVLMACGAVNVAMWARIRPFRWQCAWLKPAAMGRSPFGFCNWEPMLLWGKATGNSVDVFTAMIRPDPELDGHPCPKPILWGVEAVSRMADVGGTICEPFSGSGTTAVACIRTDRQCIGIELEEEYCEIAARRCDRELDQKRLPFDTPKRTETQRELFAEVTA